MRKPPIIDKGRWQSPKLCEAIISALPIGVVAFNQDLRVINSNDNGATTDFAYRLC